MPRRLNSLIKRPIKLSHRLRDARRMYTAAFSHDDFGEPTTDIGTLETTCPHKALTNSHVQWKEALGFSSR